jgi:hypothetical protein
MLSGVTTYIKHFFYIDSFFYQHQQFSFWTIETLRSLSAAGANCVGESCLAQGPAYEVNAAALLAP